jgi:ABC-2 type transport system permease protein
MSTAAATTSSISTRPAPPSALKVGLARTSIELKTFFRDREALIFIFFFPVLLLGIFTTAFGGETIGEAGGGISVAQYYTPAMIASGIFLSSFQTLALNIALERDDGTLKRLRGTPMPPLAYFLGKIGLVIITSVLQIAILLVLAATLLDLELPSTTEAWARFTWIFLLGSAGGTVLGIAFSVIPKTARSAAAIVTPVVLILQFISGIFFIFYNLPSWMQQIGALFPLKWLAQGMRSVFLPEQMAALEVTGTWETPKTAIVLLIWLVIGLAACRLVFRWTPRGSV